MDVVQASEVGRSAMSTSIFSLSLCIFACICLFLYLFFYISIYLSVCLSLFLSLSLSLSQTHTHTLFPRDRMTSRPARWAGRRWVWANASWLFSAGSTPSWLSSFSWQFHFWGVHNSGCSVKKHSVGLGIYKRKKESMKQENTHSFKKTRQCVFLFSYFFFFYIFPAQNFHTVSIDTTTTTINNYRNDTIDNDVDL